MLPMIAPNRRFSGAWQRATAPYANSHHQPRGRGVHEAARARSHLRLNLVATERAVRSLKYQVKRGARTTKSAERIFQAIKACGEVTHGY